MVALRTNRAPGRPSGGEGHAASKPSVRLTGLAACAVAILLTGCADGEEASGTREGEDGRTQPSGVASAAASGARASVPGRPRLSPGNVYFALQDDLSGRVSVLGGDNGSGVDGVLPPLDGLAEPDVECAVRTAKAEQGAVERSEFAGDVDYVCRTSFGGPDAARATHYVRDLPGGCWRALLATYSPGPEMSGKIVVGYSPDSVTEGCIQLAGF